MISCILLAAGESRRFGSPKALADLRQETVIASTQRVLLASRVSETIIVLGASREKIKPCILKDPSIKTVVNTRYREGQTSSFKKGLTALDPKTRGIMLLPVDVPLIQPQTLNQLIEVFTEKQPLILLPTYHGQSGHPPIFSARLLKEFECLASNAPLFTIQRAHAGDVVKIPVEDKGVVLSFNTPQELKTILNEATTYGT